MKKLFSAICAICVVFQLKAGDVFVAPAPQGKNSNHGMSASAPLATIDRAVALASPGDFVHLAPGTYDERARVTKDLVIAPQGAVSVRALVIDGGSLRLDGPLTISEVLDLTAGKGGTVRTDNHVLTLAPQATLRESEYRFVIGRVRTSRAAVTAAEDFGGLGLSVDPGAYALGRVAVTRTTGLDVPASRDAEVAVDRQWALTVSQPAPKPVALSFGWSEANDVKRRDLNNVVTWLSDDQGATWEQVGVAVPAPNRQLKTTLLLPGEAVLTVADQPVNPTPVALQAFEADKTDEGVLLSWTTPAEQSSLRFEIQRSLDGVTYETVETLPAVGEASTPTAYQFVDSTFSVQENQRIFYRLKHYDYNDRSTFYPANELNLARKTRLKLPPVGLPAQKDSVQTNISTR